MVSHLWSKDGPITSKKIAAFFDAWYEYQMLLSSFFVGIILLYSLSVVTMIIIFWYYFPVSLIYHCCCSTSIFHELFYICCGIYHIILYFMYLAMIPCWPTGLGERSIANALKIGYLHLLIDLNQNYTTKTMEERCYWWIIKSIPS